MQKFFFFFYIFDCPVYLFAFKLYWQELSFTIHTARFLMYAVPALAIIWWRVWTWMYVRLNVSVGLLLQVWSDPHVSLWRPVILAATTSWPWRFSPSRPHWAACQPPASTSTTWTSLLRNSFLLFSLSASSYLLLLPILFLLLTLTVTWGSLTEGCSD